MPQIIEKYVFVIREITTGYFTLSKEPHQPVMMYFPTRKHAEERLNNLWRAGEVTKENYEVVRYRLVEDDNADIAQ